MAYKALYREYRPQTFDEVVGQKYIIQTLKNAIKDERIAHAYLFTGPRGTGKTTIAKLIAKGLNCTCEDHKPCGECENCKAIAAGTFPDVIEIDAASNNSVDEVRDLIDKVKYAPVEGKYKVYIIDEVHMMTSSAFNALLKTLEEPPAHVIFILATTEVHKVLPTIVSRCQRFDFGRISTDDLKERIETVLRAENIEAEKGVSTLIAKLADGGVRDALGILDQTISYAGNSIKCQDVRDIYGVLSVEEAVEFIEYFNNEQVNKCLEKINEYDNRGIDIVRFTNYLIDLFKELVVFNKTKSLDHCTILTKETALSLARIIDSDTAFRFIDILLEASFTYKKVNTPKTYFELACLKLCNCEKAKDIIEVSDFVEVKTVVEQSVLETKVDEVVEEEIPEEEPVSEVEETVEEPIAEPVIEESTIEETIIEEEMVEVSNDIEEKMVEEAVIEEAIIEQPIVEDVVPVIEQPVINIEPAKPISDMMIIEEIVLNYMTNSVNTPSSNELKKHYGSLWNSVYKYVSKPVFAKAASSLRDGSIAVACEDGIVIQMDTEAQANVARSPEMYFECKNLLQEIFGKDLKYITISTEQFKKFRIVFVRKMQEGHLPEAHEITDLFTKESVDAFLKGKEVKVKKPEEVELGEALFGDLFKIN